MTPALLRAYWETVYEVDGIILRIGRRSASADRWLNQHGATQAALITAWNPYSRRLPEGRNRRLQRSLLEVVRRSPTFPAFGRWRRWSEEHVAVVTNCKRATMLCRVFRQHAFVMLQCGKPVRLILTFRSSVSM
jgi:hypothetical protein